jgi:hypothetical protein
MMPSGVSKRSLIRGIVPLFCRPPLLIPVASLCGFATPSDPASRHRLATTVLPKPSILASSFCCPRPDGQTMVGGNVARGCLFECSGCELWAASLVAELVKCRTSLAVIAQPPGVRSWGFLNGHLLSSEKGLGEDFWL